MRTEDLIKRLDGDVRTSIAKADDEYSEAMAYIETVTAPMVAKGPHAMKTMGDVLGRMAQAMEVQVLGINHMVKNIRARQRALYTLAGVEPSTKDVKDTDGT